jgi:hypothetical protein
MLRISAKFVFALVSHKHLPVLRLDVSNASMFRQSRGPQPKNSLRLTRTRSRSVGNRTPARWKSGTLACWNWLPGKGAPVGRTPLETRRNCLETPLHCGRALLYPGPVGALGPWQALSETSFPIGFQRTVGKGRKH